jgi:hypothetical protein
LKRSFLGFISQIFFKKNQNKNPRAIRGTNFFLGHPWNTHPHWFGQPVPGGLTGAARAPVPIFRSLAGNARHVAASASVGNATGNRESSPVGSRRPELGAWLACTSILRELVAVCCAPVPDYVCVLEFAAGGYTTMPGYQALPPGAIGLVFFFLSERVSERTPRG